MKLKYPLVIIPFDEPAPVSFWYWLRVPVEVVRLEMVPIVTVAEVELGFIGVAILISPPEADVPVGSLRTPARTEAAEMLVKARRLAEPAE